MFVSVVVAIHNEEESIRQLMLEIDSVKRIVDHEMEVLFIDDVSTDNSRNILKEIESEYPYVRIFTLERRGGQTGCYLKALEHCKGKYFLRIDGDLQDNPKDLHKFFPLLENDADLVLGLREVRRHSRMIRLAGLAYDFLVVLLCNSPLQSNSASFLAVKTEILKGVNLKKHDHRYFPLITIKRGASRIMGAVVEHRPRQYGSSKYNPFKKILFGIPEVIGFLIKLKMGYYDRDSAESACNTEKTKTR